MLKLLLKKEIRRNRRLICIALAVSVFCFVCSAVQGLTTGFGNQFFGSLFVKIIWSRSIMSHIALQFSLPILAANAIAAERADRSLVFLGYLPITRSEILAPKALLLGLVCVALSVLHFVVIAAIATTNGLHTDATLLFGFGLLYISAAGFCASGIGWCASCIANSAATAILAVIVLFPTIYYVQTALALIPAFEGRDFALPVAIWTGVGLAGFAWGTRYFLSRREL